MPRDRGACVVYGCVSPDDDETNALMLTWDLVAHYSGRSRIIRRMGHASKYCEIMPPSGSLHPLNCRLV